MSKALTLEETCAILRLDSTTVADQARLGRIPGAKIGKQWRFHADVIDQLLRGEHVTARETADGSSEPQQRERVG